MTEPTAQPLENKKSPLVIDDYTTCYYCKSTGLDENDKFCPNCRFPQRGTAIEKRIFMVNVKKKEKALAGKQKAVKRARIILYILAAINLVIGFALGLLINEDMGVFIASLVGAGIYFGLAVWSKTKPFAAILSGFFVYIVFNVLNAIVDPHTIYQGIVLKILIILGFIYGYKGVKEAEKIENELQTIKVSKDLSENDNLQ